MSILKELLHCCQCNETAHLSTCHFCNNLICTRHSHYIAIPYHTLYGVTNKVLMVCDECYPKQRI
ncbi:MAG: hypothetical protein INQ03_10840 [Candidatus Heimdallarchaeota archaeon]|nr:hypothetical protein [Candidatus Heimdallarchaeota archaeon]